MSSLEDGYREEVYVGTGYELMNSEVAGAWFRMGGHGFKMDTYP